MVPFRGGARLGHVSIVAHMTTSFLHPSSYLRKARTVEKITTYILPHEGFAMQHRCRNMLIVDYRWITRGRESNCVSPLPFTQSSIMMSSRQSLSRSVSDESDFFRSL